MTSDTCNITNQDEEMNADMVSQRMQEFSERIRANRAANLNGNDVVASRASMEAEMAKLRQPADVQHEDVTVGGRPARWFRSPDSQPDRVMLYLHGGAYVRGSINTHAELMARLSQTLRIPVLGLDYRLAPEHPYPAALDDAVASYRWLLETGLKPQRIVVGGDSAGGGLALATLQALKEASLPQPAGAVLFSPWTDLSGSGDSVKTRAKADPMVDPDSLTVMAAHYLDGMPADTPGASPLFGNLSGLAPLLIQVGDAEVLLDDATRLYQRAQAAGVDTSLRIFDGGFHVFQAIPALPEAAEALADVAEFCQRVTDA
ncbi:MAG: alpha/beta hydrolase [Gammaproteobacteria bacterium]|nr:MAG: alpha/beta hydrolase [Gammaproteobacteria bacterium]